MADELTEQLVQRAQDEQAEQTQEKDPTWKKLLRKGLEGGTDLLLGSVGVGPDTKANKLGELLTAGIPFSAPLKRVFHGSNVPWRHYDIGKNQNDTWLPFGAHFAEDPKIAERFGSRITPATLDVKNALDISKPVVGPDRDMIMDYIQSLKDPGKQRMASSRLHSLTTNAYKPSGRTNDLDQWLREDPQFLDKLGFDGVKYGSAYKDGDVGWVTDPYNAWRRTMNPPGMERLALKPTTPMQRSLKLQPSPDESPAVGKPISNLSPPEPPGLVAGVKNWVKDLLPSGE